MRAYPRPFAGGTLVLSGLTQDFGLLILPILQLCPAPTGVPGSPLSQTCPSVPACP